jgi:hypothetical protein
MRKVDLCIAATAFVCAGLVGQGCSGGGAGGQGDGNGFGSGSSTGSGSGSGGTHSAGASGNASTSGQDSSTNVSVSGGSTGSVQNSGQTANDAGNSRDATTSADGGGADSSVSASGDGGSLDAIRQACVDHINMKRATLNLPPLMRATPAQEACSDMGAMKDATSGGAHSSAGSCPPFGAQDTCPQLPVGGFSGATLQSSLIQCLDQMWAEGPPPGTIMACIQDYQGCFLKYGHYINMSDSSSKRVSCGFYKMSSGDYWGNQDFAP